MRTILPTHQTNLPSNYPTDQPPDYSTTRPTAPLDFSRVLADADPDGARPRRFMPVSNAMQATETLDDWLCAQAMNAIITPTPIQLTHAITMLDRTVGARIAGEIARRYGDAGLPPRTIDCVLHGSAGQSFGAFCINGLRLELWGEANDYVGKGMAGGELVLRLPSGARYASHENFIMGNTALYGATGGALFAAGRAGERFAVRNSGATAVVEGVGDHGCEYMTGGAVVVLGKTGRNFAAGMTGGVAYVYDADGLFTTRLNDELVTATRGVSGEAETQLHELIAQHVMATASQWAQGMLETWATRREKFWVIRGK
jgi:glutamate synthase (ferredoxin)